MSRHFGDPIPPEAISTTKTSWGADCFGLIPSLNEDGLIDSSMLPTTSDPNSVKALARENIVSGQPLTAGTVGGGFYLARADVLAKATVVGFAVTTIANGYVGTAAGVAANYNTSYTATAPFLVIQNANTANQRCYLDYIGLNAIAAMVSTTTAGYTGLTVVLDSINRSCHVGAKHRNLFS
jgi:hypothetical protein